MTRSSLRWNDWQPTQVASPSRSASTCSSRWVKPMAISSSTTDPSAICSPATGLKRAQLAYSAAESVAYMQRIRDVFDTELLRAKAGGGEQAPTPVFIVGMPRSGTTLIEQIIASHPKAFGAGELFTLDKHRADPWKSRWRAFP